MLYHLHELASYHPVFGLLRHAELRAVLAALTAFLIALLFGRWFIDFQRQRSVFERAEKGDSARLSDLHQHKGRTPTMGGVILLLATVSGTLCFAHPESRLVHVLLITTLGFGLVGFADDLVKLRSRRKGLSARAKLLFQVGIASLVGWYLYRFPIEVGRAGAGGELGTALFVPFVKDWHLPLGGAYVLLVVLVTTGASNAVNLTDGLDGLAIGCSVLVGLTLATVALLAGHERSSAFLEIPHVAGGSEVAVFASALVGAGMGFLWFNCHPAQIFMGDTGALAVGGALGLVAVLCKQEVLLVLAGGVLVAEVMSVVLQVASFKLRGKRIFLIAPLHHHYQFLGWNETKVTVRFWIAAALLALVSLASLKLA